MRFFLLTVLLVWTLMHAYVFWRASSVPLVARCFPRSRLIGLACVLWASYILARILDHAGVGTLARIWETLGAYWIGILFLLLVAFLAVDLVTAFGWLLPRLAPTLRGGALLAGAVLSVIAFVQGHRAPVVTTYEVRLPGLPPAMDGTVLILASDFHLGTQLGKAWLDARVRQIMAERPDIIVLAGDILEGDDPSERELLPPLRNMHAPLGVWAVTGNHEFYEKTQSSAGVLETSGINVLHDRWVEVRPGFVLAGVDDLTSRRWFGQMDHYIQHALQGRPEGVTTLLISHTPLEMETAAKSGANLMLSAHTHAGQIWPFHYVVRLTLPLLAGKYEVDGMPIIVCRGTGTWGPTMRLWKRGEIVRIALRTKATQPGQLAAY